VGPRGASAGAWGCPRRQPPPRRDGVRGVGMQGVGGGGWMPSQAVRTELEIRGVERGKCELQSLQLSFSGVID